MICIMQQESFVLFAFVLDCIEIMKKGVPSLSFEFFFYNKGRFISETLSRLYHKRKNVLNREYVSLI